jgi:hypothetical protein
MAFAERMLRFTFSGAQTGTLSVAGLRAVVNAQEFLGKSATIAKARIWGLSLDQMNRYSTALPGAVALENFSLSIEAGDVGSEPVTLVNALIYTSCVDLGEAPDSAFSVSVAGAAYQSAKTIASQSWAGAQDAQKLIQAVCSIAGLTLVNNGAHAVLNNMATYGSAIDQIQKIADAAGFSWCVEGTTVSIWPRDGLRDDTVVQVGPDTGMVGYPQFTDVGLIVRSLFNSEIQVGRQMQVTSSLPKANVTWPIVQVQHDLATMLRNGPWFTTAVLGPLRSGDHDAAHRYMEIAIDMSERWSVTLATAAE